MIPVVNTLLYILNIYWWIVIIACVFSWLYAFKVINSSNQVVNAIGNAFYQLTEPVFGPIRRMLPNFGGVDIAPLVVLVIIFFLQQLLVYSVYG